LPVFGQQPVDGGGGDRKKLGAGLGGEVQLPEALQHRYDLRKIGSQPFATGGSEHRPDLAQGDEGLRAVGGLSHPLLGLRGHAVEGVGAQAPGGIAAGIPTEPHHLVKDDTSLLLARPPVSSF
jgi:hypothetical protein